MRIAILGAGYAGVTLVRRLERRLDDDVDLVLVDETGEHLVQHELHRVIRRPSLADDITVPLDDVVDRAAVRRERVAGLDPDAREVRFADESGLDYDYVAVCLGAETAFYGLDGVREHGIPLKRLADAHRIRRRYLEVLEEGGRVVVGGAGLSGVQVAGELAAMAREERGDAEILLLEQESEVAPRFPANFQSAVREELAERDVRIRTGATVTDATEEAVEVEGGYDEDCDLLVWTGGIAGSDALGGQRPVVRNDLRTRRDAFVLGDAGRVVDADGEAVPASAQAAVREARVVAENLGRLVEADRDPDAAFDPRLKRFAFDSPGWLVSVGDGAVAQVGPTVVTGTAALALKATVGAGYLSSVGAVRKAVQLVDEELGLRPEDHEGPELDRL